MVYAHVVPYKIQGDNPMFGIPFNQRDKEAIFTQFVVIP